ncbi:MAG: hypothetical protein ACYTGG_10805 [Planctomycetota bacterium]|jgi:hypothetical protein
MDHPTPTSPRALRFPTLLAMTVTGILTSAAAGQSLPTVGPQIRIDTGGSASANETTVSVSEANAMQIIAGWNDYRFTPQINSGFALSMDGGATWSEFILRPSGPNQALTEGDPMTAFDPRTGTLWAGAIAFSSDGGIYVTRKLAAESNFGDVIMARESGGADKGWMVAGPRPGQPNTTRLYITYNEGVIRSDDLGMNWTDPVSLGIGVGFLPRIGPNGELYVAYWDFDTGVMLKRSLDGGQTFTTHTIALRMDVWGTQSGSRFPGSFRVPSITYMDVDDNTGTLYASYVDTTNIVEGNSNVDIYFTKSTDQGTSWTTPVVVNADGSPPGDQFFNWLEVDKDGRLHLVWLDSRNVAQDDNDPDGMFDAYYAYSADGGETWTEYRLTPSTWSSNGTNFVGDYMGLSVAGRKAFPVYVSMQNGDQDIYTNIVSLPLVGDLDGDDEVTIADLLILFGDWGACPGCSSDLNGDGVVDILDLPLLLGNWT